MRTAQCADRMAAAEIWMTKDPPAICHLNSTQIGVDSCLWRLLRSMANRDGAGRGLPGERLMRMPGSDGNKNSYTIKFKAAP